MSTQQAPAPIILASMSPYRKALLARLGVPFTVSAARVDEEELKSEWRTLPPAELALRLGRAKAESVAKLEANALVIGCDQLVSCDGVVLGKPLTAANAVSQLSRMQGR